MKTSFSSAFLLAALCAGGCGGGGAGAPPPRCGSYVPREAKQTFDGRVGAIRFRNTSERAVTVGVYHPDGAGGVEQSWRVAAGETADLGDGFGNDWGIRVDDSCVQTVGRVSAWDGSAFSVVWPDDGFDEVGGKQ